MGTTALLSGFVVDSLTVLIAAALMKWKLVCILNSFIVRGCKRMYIKNLPAKARGGLCTLSYETRYVILEIKK